MRNSEYGRSMVEILGVLAVMGVLSVGGIAGYTTAMLKYKVNEILSGVRERALAISAYQGFGRGEATDLLGYKNQLLKGHTVSLYPKIEGTDFAIAVGNVSKKECDQIASLGLESAVLVRPNLCDMGDDNTLIFAFKNDLAGRADRWGNNNEYSEQKDSFTNDPCSNEGGLQCQENEVQKCKKDTSGTLYWVTKERCLYGCSNGVCVNRVCTPSHQKCLNSSVLLTCKNDGQWGYPGVSCAFGCSADKCNEDCSQEGEIVCFTNTDNTYKVLFQCRNNEGVLKYQSLNFQCEITPGSSQDACQSCRQRYADGGVSD